MQNVQADAAVNVARAITDDWFVRHNMSEFIRNMWPDYFGKFKEGLGELISGSLKSLALRVRSGELTEGQAIREMMTNIASVGADMGKQFLPVIGATVGIFVLGYGAKRGFDFLKEMYLWQMKRPQLLRQVLQPSQITRKLDELYFEPVTESQIKQVIQMATLVTKAQKRSKFENVMLWGAPGTGKTAIVEIIAKEANMTLYKTSGGDFAKLKGKDLQQIDQLFASARKNKRPVLLFIDEMEKLFGSRAQAAASEDGKNLLAKLLTEFSEPDNQILLVGATNRPEDLDEAIHRRMPQQVQIGLPNRAGRIKIILIYKRILFTSDNTYTADQKRKIEQTFNDAVIDHMAEQIGAICPAEIYNIMIMLKNRSIMYNNGIPTNALIDTVIAEKLKQLEMQKSGFIRSI